jgi:OOP family OmpA-OmpF porin
MRSGSPLVWTITALAALGLFLPPAIEPGTTRSPAAAADADILDSPRLVFDRRAGRLLVSGMAKSARHEAALLQTARRQFPDSEIDATLKPGIILPDHWETASMRLLEALGATESAVATLESGQARVRGVTSEPAALRSRLQALQGSLPAGSEVLDEVAVVGRSASLDELCRTNFANALTRPVAFRQSSAELRTSSYALLDKIIGVANDCRASRIAITGHTDATGNEDWNRALSRARAQAVADYLVRGGIQPERLIVEGVGSAMPVADNDTPYGRRQNRRIELELR